MQRVGAGKQQMAGVEQQMHELRIGRAHQPVDVVAAHHAGTHVRVVAEPHAGGIGDAA